MNIRRAWNERTKALLTLLELAVILPAVAVNAQGTSASSALFSIFGATQDFAAGRPQNDDLTLMAAHQKEHVART